MIVDIWKILLLTQIVHDKDSKKYGILFETSFEHPVISIQKVKIEIWPWRPESTGDFIRDSHVAWIDSP